MNLYHIGYIYSENKFSFETPNIFYGLRTVNLLKWFGDEAESF